MLIVLLYLIIENRKYLPEHNGNIIGVIISFVGIVIARLSQIGSSVLFSLINHDVLAFDYFNIIRYTTLIIGIGSILFIIGLIVIVVNHKVQNHKVNNLFFWGVFFPIFGTFLVGLINVLVVGVLQLPQVLTLGVFSYIGFFMLLYDFLSSMGFINIPGKIEEIYEE